MVSDDQDAPDAASMFANPARQFLVAAREAMRDPAGQVAVILHLSRLPPTASRPHRIRVARAVMHDTATRYGGACWHLPDGDIAMLSRDADSRASGALATPGQLPALFQRLFAAETTDLVSLWPLARDGQRLLAFAARQAGLASSEPPPDSMHLASLAERLGLRRSVAVALTLHGGRARGQAGGRPSVQPLFQTLRADQPLGVDVLAAVAADLAAAGSSGPSGGRLPLHLPMGLGACDSPAFTALAATVRNPDRVPLGIEIALIDVCSDPRAYARTRALLARAGIAVIISAVRIEILDLVDPGGFDPDLIKLTWTDTPLLPPPAALRETIERLGAERVVLGRTEHEAALRWGLDAGIRRFQGKHATAMLAALRKARCGVGEACSVGQCAARAQSVALAGRAGCKAPALLDETSGRGLTPPPLVLNETQLAA